jgi:hypothetical protein
MKNLRIAAAMGVIGACLIMPASASAQSCSTVSGNLVRNCGFESGSFSDWNVAWPPSVDGDTFVGTFNVHSGNFAAELGAVPGENSVSQTILGTVPGNSYEVSFWLANDNAVPNEFHVQWNGLQVFALNNMLGLPYTRFSFIVVASGSDTLRFDEQNPPAFFHLDDVVVKWMDSAELSRVERAPKQNRAK